MNTGKNVPRKATTIATAIINRMGSGPNTNTVTASPICALSTLFSTVAAISVPITDNIRQIPTITPDSQKKILNTSAPRAPIARNIPISFFFRPIGNRCGTHSGNIRDDLTVFKLNNSVAVFFCKCGIAVTATFMFISIKRERKLISDIDEVLDKISSGDFTAQIPLTHNDMNEDDLITKLNAAISELNSVAILKSDFIRNFSHEFRTPIASIKGFSEILSKNKSLSEDEREKYYKIINEESTRLSNLANMTLMLGKFDAQSIVVDQESFYIDEQIEECALQLYAEVERKKLNVQIDLPHIKVYASKELLKELWLNLFSNAVKYTEQGGRISIVHSPTPNEDVISFIDNGIGISEEAQKHIFDAYYQENTTRGSRGIGLGLSICKRITDLHGWKLTVESVKGKGSTFSVHINK